MLEDAIVCVAELEHAVNITKTTEPSWRDLTRKISVAEAAKLNGVSEDTFRRHYRHLIKKVSPRRDVVVLGDALAVGEAKTV
jgi:hypothetical protein